MCTIDGVFGGFIKKHDHGGTHAQKGHRTQPLFTFASQSYS
jgi:hypothetical protein